MTEIEFLHEMVKAAGGNPDMLKDKLKSTYYECLINCMKNGGGSGGGRTGGGNDKVIVGVKNGDNITFSLTGEEIYALGEQILNYEIILEDDGELYRVSNVNIYASSILFDFLCILYNINTIQIKRLRIRCMSDGSLKNEPVEL